MNANMSICKNLTASIFLYIRYNIDSNNEFVVSLISRYIILNPI